MDCGTAFVKYVLFIFNSLVSIIGVVAIVNGIITLQSVHVVHINENIEYPPQALIPVGLIAIGLLVVLISLCGCCGAIQEDVCKLMSYAIFMFILLIIQFALVILLWVNKDKISTAVGKVIESAWPKSTDSSQFKIFDAIQKSLKCCGVNGSIDYIADFEAPPASCCKENNCLTLHFYEGCRQKFVNLVTGSTDKARYFGMGLIVVELIGFVFSCTLANNIRNFKRRNDF